MKNWIIAISLFGTTTLCADTSGFVEYHLPDSTQSWMTFHESEGSENRMIGSITAEGSEFFGAIYNPEADEIPDMAELQEGLQIPFPDQTVRAAVIESGEGSMLYEWSASDETQEIIHGWGRIFSTGRGTVILNYTTGQIGRVDELRPTWLAVLKEATETVASDPQVVE